jgi:hypothetical protein
VRYLRRWPRGTSYTAIEADVAGLVARLPTEYPVLAIDQTGVGKAVVRLFRPALLKAPLRSLRISAGHAIRYGDGGNLEVPRKELVSVL